MKVNSRFPIYPITFVTSTANEKDKIVNKFRSSRVSRTMSNICILNGRQCEMRELRTRTDIELEVTIKGALTEPFTV